MAAAIIAGFSLVVAVSLLVGWLHARRVDQLPTLLPTAFGLIGAAVLTVLYLLMEDRRGIVFFGAFSGLILLPWVAGLAIFGPQAWLDVAEAKLATYPDGTSILTVRYTDAAVAAARLRAEYRGTLPPLTRVAGHEGVLIETEGFASFQFQDVAQVVRVTGANRTALQRRLERSSPSARRGTGPPKFVQKPGIVALIGGVLLYTLFVSWAFVRLSTWAASFPGLAGAAPLPAETLRDRLLGVARLAVPFTVRPGDRPDELNAEWRYADVTWLDQMRAHHMTQPIRYRLRLDQADRTAGWTWRQVMLDAPWLTA
jgi:hypothetical protein